MPIYEYECKKCGVVFEMMQTMSAKPLKTCMGVGCNDKANGKVVRLISKSGFVLKGSGWYTSDYPSDDRKKGWDEESQQGKPAAPKPDGKETPATAKDTTESTAKPAAQAPSPAKSKGSKSPYSGKNKPKASSKASKK